MKKRKYTEFKIDNSVIDKDKNKARSKEHYIQTDNLKEKPKKNKNNINDDADTEKLRNTKYYNKINKYKIEPSANSNRLNNDKTNRNTHSKNRNKNIDSSNINKNLSNLTKRKTYVVPSVKIKKKKKEEKENKIIKENNIYTEENKQLFMSHLIESKQIEYLRDYEKYKVDFKDKLIKTNEKKIRAINDENLIEKLISDEEEDKEEIQIENGENVECNGRKNIKEIYEDKSNGDIVRANNSKNKDKNIHFNIIENNQNNNNNIYLKNNDDKLQKINENLKDSINEGNNYNTNNLKDNIENDKNNLNNLRKSKINTLEYIYRINNNIDINKLITNLSSNEFQTNDISNINESNNNKINNNEPESQSSDILWARKNIRPKEEINDFMKNNRHKLKINEIKLKKEKNDEALKKFISFVQLQKNINENKKINIKNTILNKEKIDENNIKKTLNKLHISEKSSESTALNQQDFLLSCYDAKIIYSIKDNNRSLFKNNSIVFDKEHKSKFFDIYNDYYRNSKSNNYRSNISSNLSNNININKKKENSKRKKVDKNVIKSIKNVINKLNNFMADYINEENKDFIYKINNYKNKKYLNNYYDNLLKNANEFLHEKKFIKNNIKSKKKYNKKRKIKNNDIIIYEKQMPLNEDKKYKKIPINQNKNITSNNNNQNNENENKYKNIYLNNNELIDTSGNDNCKNIQSYNNIKKSYKFNEEELNRYKQIFNYFCIYMKLFIQKNAFNIIIYYTNIKNKYLSGFNQLVFFIKKRPFNYLRVIQQREYYQVILRQFYLPYLNKAFNNIKLYAINQQKFSDAEHIIKQIYFMNFFKKIIFYIQIKEVYISNRFNDNEIIEEEKDDKSYDSSPNFEHKNNLLNNEGYDENDININMENKNENITISNKNEYIDYENSIKQNNSINNKINENYNDNNENINLNESMDNQNLLYKNKYYSNNDSKDINEESINKENSQSYDEVKIITNTFNIIMNNISLSPKIYVFNLFKKYYLDSKNKNINKDKNIYSLKENGNNQINHIENKFNDKSNKKKNEYPKDNENISNKCDSFTEKNLINNFHNKEENNNLNNPNLSYNNNPMKANDINCQNENKNKDNNYERINNNNNYNTNIDEREIKYYKNKPMYDLEKDTPEIKEKVKVSEKKELDLCIPYKEVLKRNIINEQINKNNNKVKNNINENKNFSEKILKDEFKRYDQNKQNNYNNRNMDENKKEEINEKFNNKENSNKIKLQQNNNIIDDNCKFCKSEKIIFEKDIKNNDYNNNLIKGPKDVNCIDNLDFNFNNNFKLNNHNNIKRYSESDVLTNNENEDNSKIINALTNEMEQKITQDLTNEILMQLFNEEILNKNNILSYKKEIKHESNNSMIGLISKESMSVNSHSPGRKYNKPNNSQNLVNNNESYHTFSSNNIQDEDALNESIFKRTIYDIKKEVELNFYETTILPKLISIIEDNIDKNYLCIINNLKKPLKKNDKEVMEDLSNLITYDIIYNNNIIKYVPKFYNNDIIKKEYIEKKIINDFNSKLESQCIFYEKYNYKYLNQCIYDTINEIIASKRMYGNIGEPLIWSMRNRKLEYKYQNTKLFKNLFISDIINELKKIFFSKIGEVIENTENLNISQFSKERDIKFNENIREDLKKENEFDELDEQETTIKLMIDKVIMNQLINEVIEILEHIRYSRSEPEKYNYKSIFSCDNIPLLSFQNISNKNEYEDEENEESSEDRINQ